MALSARQLSDDVNRPRSAWNMWRLPGPGDTTILSAPGNHPLRFPVVFAVGVAISCSAVWANPPPNSGRRILSPNIDAGLRRPPRSAPQLRVVYSG
jgi:hypothetical protein